MRTVTIKKELYKFDELSFSAKEKALEECREVEFYHSDEYFSSIEKGLDMFGLEMSDYRIDWNCLGRSNWRVDKDRIEDDCRELTGTRLRTYLINNLHSWLWERKGQGEYKKRNGKLDYRRWSNITYVPTSCPFTGVGTDEDFLDPIRKFIESPCDRTTLEDLIDECVESCFQAGAEEWEHMTSDEYTEERIKEDEREFLEDGTLH